MGVERKWAVANLRDWQHQVESTQRKADGGRRDPGSGAGWGSAARELWRARTVFSTLGDLVPSPCSAHNWGSGLVARIKAISESGCLKVKCVGEGNNVWACEGGGSSWR